MTDDTTDDTKEVEFGGWTSINIGADAEVHADSEHGDLDELGRELLAEQIDKLSEEHLRNRLKANIEHTHGVPQ